MAWGFEVSGRGGEQLRGCAQVPIGIGDAGMTEVPGENGNPAGRASVRAFPFFDDAAGERMPKVVDSDGGAIRCGRDRTSQLAKGVVDGGSRQRHAPLRHQEER